MTEAIVTNWAAIAAHINASTYSVSKPTAAGVTRAVVPTAMFDDMETARHAIRALAPYVVRSDVSQFYGSLYTHSLPWALHTKPVGKANHGRTLFGNVLDECARNMQDGQTIGVPIGPDTSLVLAEIVLSAVDQDVLRSAPGTRACRQIDDIEMSSPDRSSAEWLLGVLQRSLTTYELSLNPKKTKVIEQPSPFAEPWIHALRRFRFRRGASSQKFDLLAFYDLVLRTAAEYPDGAVVKYSMSRLRPIRIDPSNWQIHERFLHQAVLAEPGVMPEALSQLIRFQALGMVLDTAALSTVIERQIVRHAPQGHGNDVAWALWATLAFGLRLSVDATDAARTMDDSVVAMLLLDAEAQCLLPGPIPPTAWEDFMATSELYGEQWLVSYEARLKGWRATKGGGDHIAADPNWAWMRANGVTFYQPVVRPVPPPVSAVASLMDRDGLGFSPA
ncbi:MAG: RNA-directed DNA polymerase [Phycisphaeraceae bacterium]|nr:RNA-directed DNA polymerase [Phycisphaeraceae bacterium]MCW5763038.1 RNA-directed DNA polymerase [Phycisphaeraceae bacterium]